jgi:hypothetical protein
MMTTRRHPRTLVEAFGPYTSHTVHPMPQPASLAERVYRALATMAGGVVAVLLLVHYFAGK